MLYKYEYKFLAPRQNETQSTLEIWKRGQAMTKRKQQKNMPIRNVLNN